MSELEVSTKQEKKVREIPKEGLTQAVCVGVVDLGTQETRQYGLKHQLQLTFETPRLKTVFNDEDGEQPFWQRAKFTWSFHEKAILPKAIAALYGVSVLPATIKLNELIGKNCMINIKHLSNDDGTFAYIESYAPLMDGLTAELPQKAPFTFFFDNFTKEDFESLSEWQQEQLKETPEYKALDPLPF